MGKTSIIERYIENTFTQIYSPSKGASYAIKNIKFEEENQNIKFKIWVITYTEKLSSLAKMFYKDAISLHFCL